jgi:hypothetical protein
MGGWQGGRQEGRKAAAAMWLSNGVMSDVAMAWSLIMVMVMVNFHFGKRREDLREI